MAWSASHRHPLRAALGAARWAAVSCGLVLLATGAVGASPAGGVLEAVQLQPEGRLLRIRLRADSTIEAYTLARQGPPERRDLVIRLPGFVSRVPARIDTGEFLLPIEVIADPSGQEAAGLRIVLGNVGDALVQVAHDAGELSILIIPPKKRSDVAGAYRIGPNDMLQIDVFGHEDLNKTLKVSPQGLINFPLIGNVRAEGHTVDEVAAEITERLGADYIRDPHVTVSVWEYLSQWVNVIGEVAQPGRYYMTGPTTLIDVLSEAGGLTDRAGGEILVTRRPEQVDPASAGQVFHIDVERLFSSEGARLDMRLRPGDVIHVRARVAAARHSA